LKGFEEQLGSSGATRRWSDASGMVALRRVA